MKKRNYPYFINSAVLLILFILFTLVVIFIDVKPIGPKGTLVGLATINEWIHHLIGVNLWLYNFTDWASITALAIALGFAILGLVQLVKRKSIFRVDNSILALGGFYLLVIAVYAFFEFNVVNYRPILIDGFLEASYPSSTTMLVLCIMPTAIMQYNRLIQDTRAKYAINLLCGIFTVLMVVGRLLSGVHWFTDIFGGVLLSAALVMLYLATNKFIESKIRNDEMHPSE